MAEQHCIYPDREAVIVAYLYDDIDAVHRVAFETHVATCEPCRTELADLRGCDPRWRSGQHLKLGRAIVSRRS